MTASLLILAVPLAYLVAAAVIASALYLVIRRGVRDGMLDARRIDHEELVERRAREALREQQAHDAGA